MFKTLTLNIKTHLFSSYLTSIARGHLPFPFPFFQTPNEGLREGFLGSKTHLPLVHLLQANNNTHLLLIVPFGKTSLPNSFFYLKPIPSGLDLVNAGLFQPPFYLLCCVGFCLEIQIQGFLYPLRPGSVGERLGLVGFELSTKVEASEHLYNNMNVCLFV